MNLLIQPKKVVELRRVSTEEQSHDGKAGLLRQRHLNQLTANAHSLEIVHEVEIVDVSGSNVLRSSKMLHLFELIRLPSISGIVVSDIDRIHRPDRYADLALLQEFADSNTLIYTPESVLDPNTNDGFLMILMRSGMAGVDRRIIRDRMWRAKEELRKQGYCPQSKITLPTGVDYDREAQEYGYNESSIKVKNAFQLILNEGLTNLNEIARRTNINNRTLANILRNPIYCGIRRYDKKRGKERYPSEDGRQSELKKIPREKDEIIEVIARGLKGKELISKDDFERVQIILREKRSLYVQSRNISPRFTYSGLLYCSFCQRQYYSYSGRRRVSNTGDYYYCKSKHYKIKAKCPSKWLNKKRIEGIIDKYVSSKMMNPEFLLNISNSVTQKNKIVETSEVDLFEKELVLLEKRRKKAYDLLINSDLDSNRLLNTCKELDNEYESLQNKLSKAKVSTKRKQLLPSAEQITQIIQTLVGYEFLSIEDKKKVVNKTVKKIILRDYVIKNIELKFQQLY